MKASILKRLEALEELANRRTLPPLTLVDLTKLPDADREAVWSGDVDTLNRLAPVVPGLPAGTVTTIIVSVGEESRDAWEATRGMSDDELDARDMALIRESESKEPSRSVLATQSEPVFDKWGYRLPV